MRRLKLPPPLHPLITLVNYDEVKVDLSDAGSWFLLDFYKITLKKNFSGSVKYGPGTYDFKEGGMAFLMPNQLVEMTGNIEDFQGYALLFSSGSVNRLFFVPEHPSLRLLFLHRC